MDHDTGANFIYIQLEHVFIFFKDTSYLYWLLLVDIPAYTSGTVSGFRLNILAELMDLYVKFLNLS